MNIEHRTSNIECQMEKDETEELIKIFVTSIKTAEKKPRLGVVECSVLDVCFLFDVGRSMFDVGCSSFKIASYGMNATCERLQNNLALMQRTSI